MLYTRSKRSLAGAVLTLLVQHALLILPAIIVQSESDSDCLERSRVLYYIIRPEYSKACSMLSANSFLIFHLVSIKVLVVLTMLIKDPSDQYTRFSAVKDDRGDVVCATDIPSDVRQVRSKMECVLSCQTTLGYFTVNWKFPNTCEIFFDSPSNYEVVNGCSFLAPGEFISEELFSHRFLIWELLSHVL